VYSSNACTENGLEKKISQDTMSLISTAEADVQ
jgi:hypothetical protein